MNINTGATPAIHNDKAVIQALQDKGDSLEHARDYGIVGCVEPVSAGRAYAHCAAVLVNVAAVLELALYNGRMRHTGSRLLTIETDPDGGFQTFETIPGCIQVTAGMGCRQGRAAQQFVGRGSSGFLSNSDPFFSFRGTDG